MLCVVARRTAAYIMSALGRHDAMQFQYKLVTDVVCCTQSTGNVVLVVHVAVENV